MLMKTLILVPIATREGEVDQDYIEAYEFLFGDRDDKVSEIDRYETDDSPPEEVELEEPPQLQESGKENMNQDSNEVATQETTQPN